MKPIRAAQIVFTIWLLVFVVSFVAPYFTAPAGDGFTRGWNRFGVWLAWQGVALLAAIVAAALGFAKLKEQKIPRRLALAPIVVEAFLVLMAAGFVIFLRVSKPEPTPNAPPPTTISPIASALQPTGASLQPPPGVQTQTFSGFYKSDFETSHFYNADRGPPWWLEAHGHERDTIQSFLVERSERRSSITVALELNGWTEENVEDIAHLGQFSGKLYVVSLNSIRPISSEEFGQAVATLTGE